MDLSSSASSSGQLRRFRRRAHTAEEAAATLRKAWCRLRLSARDPARVPPWDAVVLTAASPEQTALYNRQLERARSLGRFPASTTAIAVPDPDGARIGSGAATLHAVASLVRHLAAQASQEDIGEFLPKANGCSGDESTLAAAASFMVKKHVLLLHAGGDSKRVPWANPMGKAFLPLPYLAGDNPDGPVPLLFDHILAISSSARQAFNNQGGIFIMTGDVLPCFDASNLVLPEDAACIVTVPTTLDVAANHGVVVASKDGGIDRENYSLCLVDNLMQKPTVSELVEGHAILDDGRALLDTGIIAARGKAWQDLVTLAHSSGHTMIKELMTSKKEASYHFQHCEL